MTKRSHNSWNGAKEERHGGIKKSYALRKEFPLAHLWFDISFMNDQLSYNRILLLVFSQKCRKLPIMHKLLETANCESLRVLSKHCTCKRHVVSFPLLWTFYLAISSIKPRRPWLPHQKRPRRQSLCNIVFVITSVVFPVDKGETALVIENIF